MSSRLGSEPYCIEIFENVKALDRKVALSSESHVHYTTADVDVALQKIDQIAFPESNIVTLNARRFIEFLAEHGKPVAQDLSEWLADLERPEIIEL